MQRIRANNWLIWKTCFQYNQMFPLFQCCAQPISILWRHNPLSVPSHHMLSRVHSVSRVYFIVSMYRCKINPRHLLSLEGWDPRLGGGNIILFIYLPASPGEPHSVLASAVKCYLSPHKTRRNLKLARELISQSNDLSYTRTSNCAPVAALRL